MRVPPCVLALAVSTFVAIPIHAQSRRAIEDEIARQGYEALGQQIGAALQAAGRSNGASPKATSTFSRRASDSGRTTMPACGTVRPNLRSGGSCSAKTSSW
jgi:hypothetical protein